MATDTPTYCTVPAFGPVVKYVCLPCATTAREYVAFDLRVLAYHMQHCHDGRLVEETATSAVAHPEEPGDIPALTPPIVLLEEGT